jgi:hypothetical protein
MLQLRLQMPLKSYTGSSATSIDVSDAIMRKRPGQRRTDVVTRRGCRGSFPTLIPLFVLATLGGRPE